ncbi:MAG: hypothetical protein ABIJ08_06645 [Nanoarchaeota archaeon]
MPKKSIHVYIGIFLIIIGVLPFLGIGLGILTTIVHVLTILSGIVILLTK